MLEEKTGTKTSPKKSCGRKKPIPYVYEVSDTPMSPEEWEQVQRLLAKIIAEVYLEDLRSKKSGE